MLRNEPCWFLQLGLVLERADNTARLLDVKYHVLLPKGEQVGGALDQAQWTALLRSVRSEEHTSELQSLMRISYAVFCLKKKKKQKNILNSTRLQTIYKLK